MTTAAMNLTINPKYKENTMFYCSSCGVQREPDQLSSCPTCGALTCGLQNCEGNCLCTLPDPLQQLASDVGLDL